MPRASCAALAASLTLLLGGCDPTAVLLVVEGPFLVPEQLDALSFDIIDEEGHRLTQRKALEGGPRQLEESLRLIPGERVDRWLCVTVSGLSGSATVARTSGRAAFVDGEEVRLDLLLAMPPSPESTGGGNVAEQNVFVEGDASGNFSNIALGGDASEAELLDEDPCGLSREES